jgi:uncharacterized OsmC-like protein
MSSEHIRQSLEAAAGWVATHVDEARYTDSAATAVIARGLRVRVIGPGAESVETDMPTSVGGDGSAPSPGWLLRAAEAACTATLIAMCAAQSGVELERLEVTVDSISDDRGVLGLDDAVPAGPLSSRIAVSIAAQAPREQLESIVHWGVDHCPVVDGLRRAVPVTVEVDTGPAAG